MKARVLVRGAVASKRSAEGVVEGYGDVEQAAPEMKRGRVRGFWKAKAWVRAVVAVERSVEDVFEGVVATFHCVRQRTRLGVCCLGRRGD